MGRKNKKEETNKTSQTEFDFLPKPILPATPEPKTKSKKFGTPQVASDEVTKNVNPRGKEMGIPVNEITDKQLQEILGYKEGHFLDLKSKLIKPSKLTKTMSAFANADGGEVYIGIEESNAPFPHKWQGFSRPEEANAHLQVFESLFPLGNDFLYNFIAHTKQTGIILQVTILKTKAVTVASDGIPYVRRGAQNLPVNNPESLALLQRNKGITSFENEPVAANTETICNSEAIIKFILEVVPSSEPEPWLQKQECIKDGKPTVAGVVLFSDLPQAILPKHTGIKVYRYKTSDTEGARETLVGDPLSVEGCAYDIIKEAVLLTKEIISGIQVIGTRGLEQVNYPTETLHEVITNAILHRDYSIADDVHVRIFDNRVEVESPGDYPPT